MKIPVARARGSCRLPRRLNLMYSLGIAVLFILVSAQVRVELVAGHVRIHFPTSLASALRATVGFLGRQGRGETLL